MENMIELSKNEMGSIYKCQHGVVHIHCKGVSLHFTEEAFLSFTRLVDKASSKLMDLNLAELIKRK